MADYSIPWDSIDNGGDTYFVDPLLTDDGSGQYPIGDIGGIGDLGPTGTDPSNSPSEMITSDFPSAYATLDNGQEQALSDGSFLSTDSLGNVSWTSPDGITYPDVIASPDGTVVQFSDGSIWDSNTGKQYGNMQEFIDDPGTTGAGNNGVGSMVARALNTASGNSGSGSSGGGKSASGANSSQNNQLNALMAGLSKFGSSLAGLLGGTAKAVPVSQKSVAQAGTAQLGGSIGLSALLVLGGIGLLLILAHEG